MFRPLFPKNSCEVALDNIRPAELLLRVYSLLENDEIQTEGAMVAQLRTLVQAGDEEDLLLVYNEIFLGLIRESAQMPRSELRRSALENLLRQAVVAACTGLDAYLPSLLRVNLPIVIRAKGRDFFPFHDKELRAFFDDLRFDLPTTLRLLEDPDEAPRFIADKILGLTKFKYLSSRKGVYAVGALLGLHDTWSDIAARLHREQGELTRILDATTRRRNDIVHRADRPQTDPTADIQEIGFAWARQSVDTIKHVCLALDELVAKRITTLDSSVTENKEVP